MLWPFSHRQPVEEARRLDAAVSGVINASETTGRAARALSASTSRVKAKAEEMEESALRRLQEQEVRRSRGDPRIETAMNALKLLERH